MAKQNLSSAVDAYLAQFSGDTLKQLKTLRRFILATVPEAAEVISYGMPAYKINTVLVFFAGYAKHIGFYPTGAGIAAFQKEIAGYKNSKGAVQFEIHEPLPLDLIKKMLLFRKAQDAEKAGKTASIKICSKGHRYKKSSECPTCPTCEKLKKADAGEFASLSAPAIRALRGAGINKLKQLKLFREADVLALHGFGISGLKQMKALMATAGVSFKK